MTTSNPAAGSTNGEVILAAHDVSKSYSDAQRSMLVLDRINLEIRDQPFSALDVLVAENLRHELLDLWLAKNMPTRAILMVTHNIDEAVGMADRLLVFGADPGHIRAELPGLPIADRQRKDAAHAESADTCYRIMTNPKEAVAKLMPQTPVAAAPAPRLHQMLPYVAIGDLSGFIERLQSLGGREPLYKVAHDLRMDADDLLPIVNAADLLGFADVQEGHVLLTAAGSQFALADVLEKKKIFSREAAADIELIGEIRRELDENHGHRLPEQPILAQIEQSFTDDEARRQLQTARSVGGATPSCSPTTTLPANSSWSRTWPAKRAKVNLSS